MSFAPEIGPPHHFGFVWEGPSRLIETVFVWGRVPSAPAVAIVGTRRPSRVGARAAHRLAFDLASQGVVIASGGALGVDTAAHEGALAAGGRTVVFAPAPLDRAYPPENRALFERILASDGAYVSLRCEGAPARLSDFFQRNAALVDHARGLVLVQCGHRSGAKNAYSQARKLGRPTWVMPSVYSDRAGVGSNALLERGASALLRLDPVLMALGLSGSPVEGVGNLSRAVVPEAPVLRAIAQGAGTADAISAATGLEAREVGYQVLLFMLDGRVSEDARGLLRYHPPP